MACMNGRMIRFTNGGWKSQQAGIAVTQKVNHRPRSLRMRRSASIAKPCSRKYPVGSPAMSVSGEELSRPPRRRYIAGQENVRLITQQSMPVRQPIHDRPGCRAQAVGQPFREEVDAVFALMDHVGAQVQELVIRDWMKEGGADTSSPSGTEMVHGERDEADVRPAFPAIQLERNLWLQRGGIDLEMHHYHVVPIVQQERSALGHLENRARAFTGYRRL